MKLTSEAFNLIQEFNNEKAHTIIDKPEINEIDLHPEFGNWMVEAVPTRPYGTYEDLKDLISCYDKIKQR